MFTRDIHLLVAAQVLSGIAWASYELCSLQLLMGDAPEEGRIEFFALTASLAGITQLAGALLGGFILRQSGTTFEDIFLYSALARGAALVLFIPVLQVRGALRRVHVMLRPLTVRPTGGAVVARIIPDGTSLDRSSEA